MLLFLHLLNSTPDYQHTLSLLFTSLVFNSSTLSSQSLRNFHFLILSYDKLINLLVTVIIIVIVNVIIIVYRTSLKLLLLHVEAASWLRATMTMTMTRDEHNWLGALWSFWNCQES